MPEHVQEPMNLAPPPKNFAVPKFDNGEVVGDEIIDPIADELARQELARISLSNAELLELAKKNPPLPAWFDEEEPPPF
jgi:hypothetical protein